MNINVGHVLLAIDKIYQMGYQFGQDYLYFEGRDLTSEEIKKNQIKSDSGDNRLHGVKEKVELITAQRYEDLSMALVNGKNIIEASHHTMVALVITGLFTKECVESYSSTQWSVAAQRGKIRIFDRSGNIIAFA